MDAEWYFKKLGKELGPFTASELRHRAQEGSIRPETWVRKSADGKWVPARKIKGLFDHVFEDGPQNSTGTFVPHTLPVQSLAQPRPCPPTASRKQQPHAYVSQGADAQAVPFGSDKAGSKNRLLLWLTCGGVLL